ncbi:ATP-dependent dethiobiotin synthetase BioD 1 [bacterium BMS3Abin08]|nr:ATP-dependent dethiobiotin synthetase BioD 1 [bacterium BMS3Abin08]
MTMTHSAVFSLNSMPSERLEEDEPMNKGIFITGTDTGSGKTIITAAIARGFKSMGLNTGVMKPIETGCQERDGEMIPEDGLFLKDMADSPVPIEDIAPYRLQTPVAPSVASRIEGREISIEHILSTYKKLRDRHDIVIVEGIGGLLVPITKHYFVSDLVKDLDVPLIVVAANRLGVLNHTLLTVKAARMSGLDLTGVILNDTDPLPEDVSTQSNYSELKSVLDIPLLGHFPYVERPGKDALGRIAAGYLDLQYLSSSLFGKH